MALQNSNVHWDGIAKFGDFISTGGRRGGVGSCPQNGCVLCQIGQVTRNTSLHRHTVRQFTIWYRHPGKSVLEMSVISELQEMTARRGHCYRCTRAILTVENLKWKLAKTGLTTQCLVTDMAFTNFMPVSWKIRVRCFYAQVWPPADIPELLRCSTVKAKRSSDSNQGISG
ncbi:hypothetical protein GE21DRAFT_4767 [Neurospora crassa]|uniref:Uncharacterized protein n=1 Tax=Neurospora crassa (strain ATCC 24698 / 74-OR23-1A / CBS 708.71 / DSM 1257 / FGSC 987) TaxID=367110 RepID=Q7RXS0_NEUCR|nr:hypothetical protein NCU00439 [Neurospora crassa OR74A]EAA27467.1 hypothetical protein NCU00439 [Neurospora crassa OR74A]KHE87917.1 hypothetical protein GE21DRAFT_4767 [Neurospora crassa]|eukprot:XP_956703.1 hypothetical protein NCU00439 [Neurospora crassa OR74A]